MNDKNLEPPLVSIIVPVFNAEKTLDRCVTSILNQQFKDLELLLLDDGSTDASSGICDAFAEKDTRVTVIHKENSGVSDTRNRGIDAARGEYLQFVDSDDWITPESTLFFVRAAQEEDSDMVIADFYRVIGDRVSQKGNIEEEGVLKPEEFAIQMIEKPADFYYGVLWNKFFKRSIVQEYQIRMDDSISWCEDFIFNMEYLRHARSIRVLKVPVYYYVKTKGSLISQGMSMTKTIRMKQTVFTCYNEFCKDIFDHTVYEKKKGQVYRFLFDVANDGSVIPINIPGNYRLGDERTTISEGVLAGEGILFDMFRERKLQEKIFDIVAIRNDLATVDVKLLYCLSQPHAPCSARELADVLHVSKRGLSLSIQRLLAREMILPVEKQPEEKGKTQEKDYAVTQEAENVLSEMLFALCDFDEIQYEGFSQEEIELYEKLEERRNRNILRALKD